MPNNNASHSFPTPITSTIQCTAGARATYSTAHNEAPSPLQRAHLPPTHLSLSPILYPFPKSNHPQNPILDNTPSDPISLPLPNSPHTTSCNARSAHPVQYPSRRQRSNNRKTIPPRWKAQTTRGIARRQTTLRTPIDRRFSIQTSPSSRTAVSMGRTSSAAQNDSSQRGSC